MQFGCGLLLVGCQLVVVASVTPLQSISFGTARVALIHQKKFGEGGMSLLLSADAENPIHAGGGCKVQEGRLSSARGTELITEYCGTTANYC